MNFVRKAHVSFDMYLAVRVGSLSVKSFNLSALQKRVFGEKYCVSQVSLV
jgi:hypothetical protein